MTVPDLTSSPNSSSAWTDLGISSARSDDLIRLHFSKPTAVQSATIPLLISNKDVVVEAVTGSGKTLAFLLPLLHILQNLYPHLFPLPSNLSQSLSTDASVTSVIEDNLSIKNSKVLAMIIAPTRELAIQIEFTLSTLAPFLLTSLLIGGSTDVKSDISLLNRRSAIQKSPAVVIGTPGRLGALLNAADSPLDVRSLEVLILDEADRLLDMGFSQDLSFILGVLPKQRRTGLFSATMSDALVHLVRVGLRNPVRVSIRTTITTNPSFALKDSNYTDTLQSISCTPQSLAIHYAIVDQYHARLPFIMDYILSQVDMPFSKIIIYLATCASVDYYSTALSNLFASYPSTFHIKNQMQSDISDKSDKSDRSSYSVAALHGKMEQKRRNKVLKHFESTPNSILLATDVAARGIDFYNVDLVVHYEAPQDVSNFVHRSGRTARGGRVGQALLILAPHEGAYLELLSGRNINLEPLPITLSLKLFSSTEEELNSLDQAAQKSIHRESTETPLSIESANPSFKDQAPLTSKGHLNQNSELNKVDKTLANDLTFPASRINSNSVNILSSPTIWMEALRSINILDRALLERAVKAFVAFVRFYQEHQASFIFRLADLNLGFVAYAFGLLRLPKMREIIPDGKKQQAFGRSHKGKSFNSKKDSVKVNVKSFVPSSVDPASVRFADEARNEQRAASVSARNNFKQIQKSKPISKSPDITPTLPSRDSNNSKLLSSSREKIKNIPNQIDPEELDDDWKEFKRARKGIRP